MHQAVVGGVDGHVPDVVLVGENEPGYDVVPSFARVLVGSAFVPVIITLAVEAPRCVVTLLAAHLRRLRTLIYIFASLPIVQKPVSRITLAIVTRWRIDTLVGALVHFHEGALVYVTVGWLVALVRTIWFLVTD